MMSVLGHGHNLVPTVGAVCLLQAMCTQAKEKNTWKVEKGKRRQ